MFRRWPCLVVALLLAGCGGGDDSATEATTPTTRAPAPTTTTTVVQIEGVQTFSVVAAHAEGPLTYPEVPPVGGTHNPVWQTCGFYDAPVPSERAVHSLEHGAVWITYRPDLPAVELQGLNALARSRDLILVSRWDTGLPSPVVITAWGVQLQLPSATDPRLGQFIRKYANQGPEINAPC
jgi:hypothetical protein